MLLLLLSAPAFAERAQCTVTGLGAPFASGSSSTTASIAQFGPDLVLVKDGVFDFRVDDARSEGTLFLDGFRPARFTWTRGQACRVAVVPGPTPVVNGVILGREAAPAGAEVWIEGCGTTAVVTDGRFSMKAMPGSCALTVHAYDWKHHWLGAEVPLTVPSDGALDVSLPFGAPVGGVGVRLAADAPRIESFTADSAAKAGGMHVGDVVSEVGGAPVAGRTTAEVSALLRGALGTAVALRTVGGATFTLTRRLQDDSFVAGNMGIRVEKGPDGLVVAEVAGPAERVGVKVGDVVVSVDHHVNATVGSFTGHSRGGGERLLTVRRGTQELAFTVPVERFVVQ